jgi:hypothetical protein
VSEPATEPRPDAVAERLEGPWRQGSERRWLVRLHDGRKAVLAQLLPELARDEAVRRRYVRDAERLRDLAAPSLAQVLAIGPPPDPRDPTAAPPWRLREEPEGENLETVLARRAPLPIDEALLLLANLAEAVHEVHRRGAVVRDLHPRHVVLPPRGRPRFTDVGLARVDVLSTRTAASLVLEGSPYHAPEQLLSGTVDARADVYGLGVIAWRALTGVLPFGELPAILVDPTRLPPLDELRAGLPAGLSSLLARCLARDPNQRPRSARELAEALRGAETPGQDGGLEVWPCQGCGQPMRPGLRLCLSCGKTLVRFSHLQDASAEEFSVDLMRAGDDEAFLRRLRDGLSDVAEGQVPSLNFLVGDSRWYSSRERKALLRVPTRLVTHVSRETAEELAARLKAQGLAVEARSSRAMDRQTNTSQIALFGGLGLVTLSAMVIVAATPLGWIGVALGVLGAIGGGIGFGTLRKTKSGPLISLRRAPAALPAADQLVGRLAAALVQASADVREVVGELALQVQRLVEHRAAWTGSPEELDRVAEPVAPLVDLLVAEVQALAAIDADLRTLDEGAIVRALAASEARGEPRSRREELLSGLDRLRALEDERGRHLSRLLEAASLLARAVRLALETRDTDAINTREVRLALESLR